MVVESVVLRLFPSVLSQFVVLLRLFAVPPFLGLAVHAQNAPVPHVAFALIALPPSWIALPRLASVILRFCDALPLGFFAWLPLLGVVAPPQYAFVQQSPFALRAIATGLSASWL